MNYTYPLKKNEPDEEEEIELCVDCAADLANDAGEGFDGRCGDCADHEDELRTDLELIKTDYANLIEAIENFNDHLDERGELTDSSVLDTLHDIDFDPQVLDFLLGKSSLLKEIVN